jgi:hypothetical protein
MLIPFGFDDLGVLFDQFANLSELPAAQAMRLGQQKRLNPELSVFFCAFNVNVNRLLSLPAKEEKPIAVMSKLSGTTRFSI